MPWYLIANIAFFQAGWFACLILVGFWPLVVASVIVLLHFIMIVPRAPIAQANDKRSESILLLKVMVIGFVLECFYLLGRVLVREDGMLWPPVWLLMIWLLFGTTLRYSLSWLRSKTLLSALFAAVAGPASYYAGVRLNDGMMFGLSLPFSLLAISFSWLIVFPLLLRIALPLKSEHVSVAD